MSVKLEIIENFLSEADLYELQSIKLKETNYKEMNVYVNKIKDNQVSGDGIEDESVKRLHQNYHSRAIEILKKLYPEKANLYEYSEFGITDTGPDYKFPIHNDTPNKLLSGVIYISPKIMLEQNFIAIKMEKMNLTLIGKQIGQFFFQETKKSWHSFNGDKNEVRRVLIYNLMTSNVREVCKIEKINYFIVKLKHIINPYLYRYFKFVI